jgi:hypothetical protein
MIGRNGLVKGWVALRRSVGLPPSQPPAQGGRCRLAIGALSSQTHQPYTSPLMGEAGRGWGPRLDARSRASHGIKLGVAAATIIQSALDGTWIYSAAGNPRLTKPSGSLATRCMRSSASLASRWRFHIWA